MLQTEPMLPQFKKKKMDTNILKHAFPETKAKI